MFNFIKQETPTQMFSNYQRHPFWGTSPSSCFWRITKIVLEEVASAFPFFSVIFLPDYPWFSNTKITLSPWPRVIISFLSMLELHAKKVATMTRLPMYKTTDAWELEFYWSICVAGNYPLTKKNLLINAKVLKNDTTILELQKICDNKIKYKV